MSLPVSIPLPCKSDPSNVRVGKSLQESSFRDTDSDESPKLSTEDSRIVTSNQDMDINRIFRQRSESIAESFKSSSHESTESETPRPSPPGTFSNGTGDIQQASCSDTCSVSFDILRSNIYTLICEHLNSHLEPRIQKLLFKRIKTLNSSCKNLMCAEFSLEILLYPNNDPQEDILTRYSTLVVYLKPQKKGISDKLKHKVTVSAKVIDKKEHKVIGSTTSEPTIIHPSKGVHTRVCVELLGLVSCIEVIKSKSKYLSLEVDVQLNIMEEKITLFDYEDWKVVTLECKNTSTVAEQIPQR